jgi:hypothetical protein
MEIDGRYKLGEVGDYLREEIVQELLIGELSN